MWRRLCLLPSLVFLACSCLAQEVISWKDAANHYGQIKSVEGTIVVTKNAGTVCFLNFSFHWQTDFTAVIFAKDFDNFPGNIETYYRQKTVRVTGKIKEFRNKPEIIVTSPSQIAIIGPPAIRSTPSSPAQDTSTRGSAARSPRETATRCQARTREDTQCSRRVTPGSRYCFQHQR